jgi:hypothetical protein
LKTLPAYSEYKLIEVDINNHFDFDPNNLLIIDEFSLVYTEPATYSRIINKRCCFVSYGVTNIHDDFGAEMIHMFKDADIGLKSASLTAAPSIAKQLFIDAGYQIVQVFTSKEAFSLFFSQEEIKRIKNLEVFPNVNDLSYVFDHYICIVAGFQL